MSTEYTRRADYEETRGKEGREMRKDRDEKGGGERDSEKGRQERGAIPSRAHTETRTPTERR